MKYPRCPFYLVISAAVLAIDAAGCVQSRSAQSPTIAPVALPSVVTYGLEVHGDITSLRFYYAYSQAFGKNTAMGYLDLGHKVFYIWKGVLIPAALTPASDSFDGRATWNLDDPRMKGFKVVECDPPVRLIKVGKGQVAIAYVDSANGWFYRWKGVQFDSKAVTDNGGSGVEILDPEAMMFHVVEIDAPRFSPDGK